MSRKLSLGTYRRSSLSVSHPAVITVPLVQDASYLEMLGLKLNDAVSKSLIHPTAPATAAATITAEQLGGRLPIPAGRGKALGALIECELKATITNPHLHRATLRCLHRPLSVLVTNLSTHLLHLLSSPAIHTLSTSQSPSPNPTQLHALGLASFAGELLQVFDDVRLGIDGDARGDGLKAVREGLVSVVNRVVNPLVAGIRNELILLIDQLENPPAKSTTKSKSHPSILALHAIIPLYSRLLSRYTTTPTSQTTLASFFITLVWRGLLALSQRPFQSPSPPPSPSPTPTSWSLKRYSSPPSDNHPSTTPPPPPNKFVIKNSSPSRPMSPLCLQAPSTAASDARSLYDLLSLLPRPAADVETTRLAREAVDEAFDGLRAFLTFLEAIQSTSALSADPEKLNHEEVASEFVTLTADLPTLIALPPLLRAYGLNTPTVAAMLALSEAEYRKACLAGFGRAEECADAVGLRVLDILQSNSTTICGDIMIVIKWLEMELGTTIDD